MPNWCACTLSITGNAIPKLTNEEWIELLKTEERVCEIKIRLISDSEVRIVFDKAWSPPSDDWLYQQMGEYSNSTWTIAYCEMGMQFYGFIQMTYDDWFKETTTIEKFYKFLPDDLIYFLNGKEIYATDEGLDDYDDVKPNGRLKKFMETYHIEHMGG